MTDEETEPMVGIEDFAKPVNVAGRLVVFELNLPFSVTRLTLCSCEGVQGTEAMS